MTPALIVPDRGGSGPDHRPLRLGAIAEADAWANGRRRRVAEALGAGIGMPAQFLELALRRWRHGVRLLDTETVADRQRIADTFPGLALLPKAIAASTAVRKAGL